MPYGGTYSSSLSDSIVGVSLYSNSPFDTGQPLYPKEMYFIVFLNQNIDLDVYIKKVIVVRDYG